MSHGGGSNRPNSLSLWQMTCLITSTLIGVGVLTLPRTTTSKLYEAGWMGPLIGSVLPFLSILIIAVLSRRFPGLTFVQYSRIIWGGSKHPRLGLVLSLPWIFAFLTVLYVTTGITARMFGEVVVTAVLLDTPLEMIIITMFVLAFILCMHETDTVARVNEILFPLILFPVLFIAIASFQKAEWNHLMPLIRVPMHTLLKGSFEANFSYQGYEIMLIFFAFAHENTSKIRSGIYGIGIAVFVYLLIVVAGIAVFGYEELQRVTWPTLELVKTTQVPGLILERLESAFLAVWVAAVFTTVANGYYAMIYSLRQLFHRGIRFQRILAIVLMIPLFFLVLRPQNIIEIFKVTTVVGYTTVWVSFFSPLIHLVVLFFQDRRNKLNKEGTAGG
ncbi:spore germination protein [Brevibacillus ruminantium]|uniref:Spore germination protein n=1 Tax=Brevibacillus ruminantium TaxID=2950604 RepID=A0ABY4WB71_9BACL|nr:endospore germination permease [Brevibacillus ruminantium]USG64282.1 spore germination protein [Brevibacillus ruminantium]